MDAALKEKLVPLLRARGFQGSLPHFRRLGAERVDLFTVQFDRHGGGFIVEIARCSPSGVTMSWGKHIPANKATAHDLDKRHRLGAPGPDADGRWFRFDNGTPVIVVAESLLGYMSEAEAWWASGQLAP